MRRALVGLAVVVVLAAGGVAAWTAWPRLFPPPTAVARLGTIEQTVVATGRVAPVTEVTIASGIPGRIKAVLVKEGDVVEKGQRVIQFEDHEVLAEVRTAEARLDTARAERQKAAQGLDAARARWVEVKSGAREQEIERARAEAAEARQRAENAEVERQRLRRLLTNDYISRSQYDAAATGAEVGKSRVRAAQETLNLLLAGPKPETVAVAWAQVREAEGEAKRAEIRARQAVAERDRVRATLTTTRLASSISGRVTRKIVEPGEAVDISMPLLVVADTSRIIAKAEIDETDLGKLKLGQRADVTADAYPGRVFPAVVYEIGEAVGKRKTRPEDPVKIQDMKILEAKLELQEGGADLKLGMTVDVRIHVVRKDHVLVIPRRALVGGGPGAVVSVVTAAGGVESRRVTVGVSDGTWIEITGGLRAGEAVALPAAASP